MGDRSSRSSSLLDGDRDRPPLCLSDPADADDASTVTGGAGVTQNREAATDAAPADTASAARLAAWPPVRAFKLPTNNGPMAPPKLPSELMRATPAAAAGPAPRKVTGQAYTTPDGAHNPAAAMSRAANAMAGMLSMQRDARSRAREAPA